MNAPLDDLVKRYEGGERDPELIRQLNELAWEGFHDPWERCPLEVQEGSMDEGFDPKVVSPISSAMIERHLAAHELYPWRGPDDRYMVQFRYEAEADRTVRIFFSIEGRGHTLFKIKIVADRRVDQDRIPEAMAFCNRWNSNYRWPKALLEVPDDEAETSEGEDTEITPVRSGLLILESQYDLSAGIHQELFDDLVSSNIHASWDFWSLAKKQGF